jgi:hypothetical protein
MEDNIKMDLREIVLEGGDWTQYRDRWWTLVNKVMNLWVFIKSREHLD